MRLLLSNKRFYLINGKLFPFLYSRIKFNAWGGIEFYGRNKLCSIRNGVLKQMHIAAFNAKWSELTRTELEREQHQENDINSNTFKKQRTNLTNLTAIVWKLSIN